MALVWYEKASRTALQTSSLLHTHSFGTDTQHDYSQGNCRTICRQLQLSLNNDLFIVNVNQIIFFA